MMKKETRKVRAMETMEVSQTSEVSGRFEIHLVGVAEAALAMTALRK